MVPDTALRSIHIPGAHLDHLAMSDEGMLFLQRLDADWSYLREIGVEEIHRVMPAGDLVVMHRWNEMPWIFRSIASPPPTPDVHPAVLEYVQGRTGYFEWSPEVPEEAGWFPAPSGSP